VGLEPTSRCLEGRTLFLLSYDPKLDARKSGGYSLLRLTSVSTPEACPDSLAFLRFPAGRRLPGEKMVGMSGLEPELRS